MLPSYNYVLVTHQLSQKAFI